MRNKIFSFLLLCSLIVSIPVCTWAKDSITREYSFTSTDKNEHEPLGYFEKEIAENNVIYELKDITYKVVSEEPVFVEQEATTSTESEPIEFGTDYAPDEEVEKDGVVYTLDNTDREEVVIMSAYTQNVSGYTDYSNKTDAENAPATKVINTTNDKTGENVSLECNKTFMKTVKSPAWEDTYIDITFTSYNASEFIWNGITVKKNEDEPLKGYETQLIESVGGNKSDYEVSKIYWTGKAYKNDKGVLCRDARADVRKRSYYYRVNYAGTIIVPETKGYVYKSIYKGLKKVESGETEYQIKATAVYEAKKTSIIPVITMGIIILAFLIAGTLIIVSKKRNR